MNQTGEANGQGSRLEDKVFPSPHALATGLPEGALPVLAITEGKGNPERQTCSQVTLRATLLVWNKETDRLVVRFDLDSPYWVDQHEAASGCWSLALPRYEMLHLLCTLLQSRFMKVELRREELLNEISR